MPELFMSHGILQLEIVWRWLYITSTVRFRFFFVLGVGFVSFPFFWRSSIFFDLLFLFVDGEKNIFPCGVVMLYQLKGFLEITALQNYPLPDAMIFPFAECRAHVQPWTR